MTSVVSKISSILIKTGNILTVGGIFASVSGLILFVISNPHLINHEGAKKFTIDMKHQANITKAWSDKHEINCKEFNKSIREYNHRSEYNRQIQSMIDRNRY